MHIQVAYSEKLAVRVRQKMAGLSKVAEKQMMGGLTFMLNDKMCIGIIKDELMCRIDPKMHGTAIKMKGCRTMDFTNRPMIGYVMINESGMKTQKDFDYWIGLALDFNQFAKSSKRKKPSS